MELTLQEINKKAPEGMEWSEDKATWVPKGTAGPTAVEMDFTDLATFFPGGLLAGVVEKEAVKTGAKVAAEAAASAAKKAGTKELAENLGYKTTADLINAIAKGELTSEWEGVALKAAEKSTKGTVSLKAALRGPITQEAEKAAVKAVEPNTYTAAELKALKPLLSRFPGITKTQAMLIFKIFAAITGAQILTSWQSDDNLQKAAKFDAEKAVSTYMSNPTEETKALALQSISRARTAAEWNYNLQAVYSVNPAISILLPSFMRAAEEGKRSIDELADRFLLSTPNDQFVQKPLDERISEAEAIQKAKDEKFKKDQAMGVPMTAQQFVSSDPIQNRDAFMRSLVEKGVNVSDQSAIERHFAANPQDKYVMSRLDQEVDVAEKQTLATNDAATKKDDKPGLPPLPSGIGISVVTDETKGSGTQPTTQQQADAIQALYGRGPPVEMEDPEVMKRRLAEIEASGATR